MVLLKSHHLPKRYHSARSRGFLLLELLISVTIFAIFILFFVASFNNIFASQESSWRLAQGSMYAGEGLEVAYNVLTNTSDWSELIRKLKANPSFHPNLDQVPGFFPGPEVINGFTREVAFSDVFRSLNTHEIVDQPVVSETYYDPETIKVISTVRWTAKGGPQQVEYVTYVTRGEPQ